MNFKMFHPAQILQPFVRYFYVLETNERFETQKTLRIIADGCPGIIYQEVSKGRLQVNDKILPPAFLFGQSTRYSDMILNGRFKLFGICFYPNAVNAIFGLNAETLTDSCVDLDLLQQPKMGVLSERLSAIATYAEKFELLSNYLVANLKEHFKSGSSAMQYSMNQIVKSGGTSLLKNLQNELGLSERSFERHFKDYIGISPKLFSRICRFQSSIKQLNENNFVKLTDLAYQNNYADQSHFIRSFKEFAGVSPHQFRKRADEVLENLTELAP